MNFPMDTTELLLYITRFFVGSSILLGGVWLAEKVSLIKNRDMRETAWKSAIIASFILLLPISSNWAPRLTLNQQTNDYIDQLVSQAPPSAATITVAEQASSSSHEVADKSPQPHLNTPGSNWRLPSFIIVPGIIALLALFSLLLTYLLAIRTLGARKRVSAEHQAFLILYDICDKANIKATPYLTWTKQINSPLCLPSGEICLPEWALDDVPEQELRSLIAHEVAHLKHRDPIKLLILHALTRLFFLQPLFALAQKRLSELAEFAADEWAAGLSDNPKSVAEALYTCAQQITDQKQPQWGLYMARNKSELRARIERLLDANQSQFKSSNSWAKSTVMATIVASTVAIPALALGDKDSAKHNRYIAGDDIDTDATQTYHRSNDSHEVSVSLRGEFKLADDGIHLDWISENGYMELFERGAEIDRSIRYVNNNGQLGYTFKRSGDQPTMDESDKKWLKKVMLSYHRNNGRSAAQRVEKLQQTGGIEAVFAELDHVLPSALRHYSATMLNTMDLTPYQMLQLLRQLDRNKSDYERRMAMTDWLLKPNLDPTVREQALLIMKKIKSDYEMRMLLTAQLKHSLLNNNGLTMFRTLSDTIGSDYEMRQLLTTAVKTQQKAAAGINPYLAIAKTHIGNDYEMREFITNMTNIIKTDKHAGQHIIASLTNIGSDYELRVAVGKVIRALELQHSDWLKLINTISKMENDNELSKTLLDILEEMPDDAALREVLVKVAKEKLSSEHSMRKLQKALD